MFLFALMGEIFSAEQLHHTLQLRPGGILPGERREHSQDQFGEANAWTQGGTDQRGRTATPGPHRF